MNCQDHIAVDCPCTVGCPRHGRCCECTAHHRAAKSLPACLRNLHKKPHKEAKKERT